MTQPDIWPVSVQCALVCLLNCVKCGVADCIHTYYWILSNMVWQTVFIHTTSVTRYLIHIDGKIELTVCISWKLTILSGWNLMGVFTNDVKKNFFWQSFFSFHSRGDNVFWNQLKSHCVTFIFALPNVYNAVYDLSSP